VRALVISDTHFGTWAGEDILRDPETLTLLAPALDDLDEVVLLGDLFDFLFARVEEAFAAADGLFALLREKLQGKRVVFVAGNHDHHVVTREREIRIELSLVTGERGDELDERVRGELSFRRFLKHRLDGVEVDLRYPTYMVGDVMCTHGHYLDPHVRNSGSASSRLLGHLIWSIALGARDDPRTIEEYEAVITLLTDELYTLAQLPHGTEAQRIVYRRARRLGQLGAALSIPTHLLGRVRDRFERLNGDRDPDRVAAHQTAPDYRQARESERRRRSRVGAPGEAGALSYPLARQVRPSDPREAALLAFDRVVHNLGWDRQAKQIVFGHTHQPLADVSVPGSTVRYWNTGSWIYEPDLSSRSAYANYLKRAWPGTAVLIDTATDAPRLLELRAHLNPLNGGLC